MTHTVFCEQVPCHMPTHRMLHLPVGSEERPLSLPVSPFDCQNETVPDLGESESWTTVNKQRGGECKEGTERL